MPKRIYYKDGMTLYKYCQVHNINYRNLFAKASLYKTSPSEALDIHKNKGYSKALRENGITKDNPNYEVYYRRLVDGWDIKKALSIPYQGQGGNRRKKLDKY